ncbi:MAG: glycosyltransferase [Thermoproteota archaeon]|nr:glycosyltransferase [Thermoproteota archaeon]
MENLISILPLYHTLSLDQKGTLRSEGKTILSIIIPTYNEAENIFPLIRSIKENIPSGLLCEIIIVDDNSPDGTGRIVEDYIHRTYNNGGSNIRQYEKDNIKQEDRNCVIRICHRQEKNGLIPAYLGFELSICLIPDIKSSLFLDTGVHIS